MNLFGWDHQTWMRAFAWANAKPVKVHDVAKLSADDWETLTRVHSKWMETTGDPDGPPFRGITL